METVLGRSKEIISQLLHQKGVNKEFTLGSNKFGCQVDLENLSLGKFDKKDPMSVFDTEMAKELNNHLYLIDDDEGGDWAVCFPGGSNCDHGVFWFYGISGVTGQLYPLEK